MERPWVAADLFLIAHDEFSGKLRISRTLLACGLAGAQLAELVMDGGLIVGARSPPEIPHVPARPPPWSSEPPSFAAGRAGRSGLTGMWKRPYSTSPTERP